MTEPSGHGQSPIVELKADGAPSATARIPVAIEGKQLQLSITVPTEPVKLSCILPILQGFANQIVAAAVTKAAQANEQVSCKAGCGACCRQIVPISPSEAHAVHQLVESLPEQRRETIRQRFRQAVQRLDEANLLESLRDAKSEIDEAQVASDYFQLGIACPFLEDESCSIHQDRPLACREYLVTSPAVECSRPSSSNVRCVPISVSTSWVLRAMDWDALPLGAGWLPLVLSLEWTEDTPEPTPRPGPQWIQHFLARLARRPKPR
ncbi:MAG: YkgJ family cysteine cluster protein [Pirellulaceae bacterium]|nr:YkgJ family cysteine cluster protein [Pirellulaceae bacterium]